MFYCELCGNYVNFEDTTYSEDNDERICDDCYDSDDYIKY